MSFTLIFRKRLSLNLSTNSIKFGLGETKPIKYGIGASNTSI